MRSNQNVARWLMPLLMALCYRGQVHAAVADHHEFDATLAAPYQGEHGGDARTFSLAFDYPALTNWQTVGWRLELIAPNGSVVRDWDGERGLLSDPIGVDVRWDGRIGAAAAPAGIYRVRLQASALPAGESVEQSWEIAVGRLAPRAMPAFRAMPRPGAVASLAPAVGELPYTVYLGNLHSQTGHSDGGGDLATCTGAQDPQSSPLGPLDAYAFAQQRGLDILVASEHNHMYDGSDGTNLNADPNAVRALYRSGLAEAADFNATHPGFLAVYGLEWGVITGGGHMNIFNTAELLGWERNRAGALLADTLTPKSDYAALYTLMRQRGWVGQFNHPQQSGQFVVGGVPLGYSADGDQAMALCEVVNTNAFSSNTTETEKRRSNYEGACNKALEAGYHVAFSSDQDNHCANWGVSYTNRTGLLVPNGVALSPASFLEALSARRVFATMDKGSQLVLTANGRMMGERFTNSGPLALVAHFASAAGKAVSSVAMFEGVPGRNGTVSVMATVAATTIVPAPGQHFYYVRVTQDDGNMLWSAPIWVTQVADGTGPGVSVGGRTQVSVRRAR